MALYIVQGGSGGGGEPQLVIPINKNNPVDGSVPRYNAATDELDLNAVTTVQTITDGGNF